MEHSPILEAPSVKNHILKNQSKILLLKMVKLPHCFNIYFIFVNNEINLLCMSNNP